MLRFGTRSSRTRAHKGDQMRTRVSQLRLSKSLPHLSGGTRSELIRKMRAFFGIAGLFAGIYVYLPSALAEVEEDQNQSTTKHGYDISTISNGLTTSFSLTRITNDEATRYLSTLDDFYGDSGYARSHDKSPSGFDETLIPEAVWSLDGSMGVHIDRISGGSETDVYARLGQEVESTDFWLRTFTGLWNEARNNIDPSIQFQVASCGGTYAERSSLDYCEINGAEAIINNNNLDKVNNNDDLAAKQATNSSVTLSSGTSSSRLDASSNIAPLISATANNFLLQGDLTVLSQRDDVSASWSIQIELQATIIDSFAPGSPTPPIDDLTSSIDPSPTEVVPPPIVLVDDPDQRPIPEAPTWVMTAIGFGIMVVLFRKRKTHRIYPISIVDYPEVY
jgi:hypothetical protein